MISFNIILMGKFLISHIFGKNLLNSKDIMQSRKQLLYLLDNFFSVFRMIRRILFVSIQAVIV